MTAQNSHKNMALSTLDMTHSNSIKLCGGGGGGIRTHGTLSRTPVFKTGAFDHSATPPVGPCYRPDPDSERANRSRMGRALLSRPERLFMKRRSSYTRSNNKGRELAW